MRSPIIHYLYAALVLGAILSFPFGVEWTALSVILLGLLAASELVLRLANESLQPQTAWGSPVNASRPPCNLCRDDNQERERLGGTCPVCTLRASAAIPPCLYCGNPEMPAGLTQRCPGCSLRAIHSQMATSTLTPNQPRPELRQRPDSALRCAYCRDALGDVSHTACHGCGTALHDACWSEEGGCVTIGCSSATLRRRAVGGAA